MTLPRLPSRDPDAPLRDCILDLRRALLVSRTCAGGDTEAESGDSDI